MDWYRYTYIQNIILKFTQKMWKIYSNRVFHLENSTHKKICFYFRYKILYFSSVFSLSLFCPKYICARVCGDFHCISEFRISYECVCVRVMVVCSSIKLMKIECVMKIRFSRVGNCVWLLWFFGMLFIMIFACRFFISTYLYLAAHAVDI